MRYTTFALSTPDHDILQSIIKDCPFGILHIRCRDTGSKIAVLVKLRYSGRDGLICKVAHTEKDKVTGFCDEPVSLKVCNKQKNIYLVANVTLTPNGGRSLLSKDGFRMIVQKFNFFRKNKSQQLVPQTAA